MTRLAFCIVATALFAVPLQAQPSTPSSSAPGMPVAPPRDTRNTTATGTALIRGRVTDAEAGTPVRGAQIRATSPASREAQIVATDGDGRYEFKDLPAGRYQLTASKGPYVRMQYGQTHAFEAGKPIELAAGQTVDRVDFRLPVGAVVTGRIVDQYGEPMADVAVAAKRSQFQQGRRQFVIAGHDAITNDIGEYRIYGLPPGEYVVSASLLGLDRIGAVSNDRTAYGTMYFPGTAAPAQAQRISLDAGQTRAGVDIQLEPIHLARITGSAIDADGKAVTSGLMMLMPAGGIVDGTMATGTFRPDGTFLVPDIAPGAYEVAISPMIAGRPGDPITASITVAGEDISGLRLTGVKPVNVTGRVTLPEGTDLNTRPPVLQFVSEDAGNLLGQTSARVKADRSFEAKVAPGTRLIRLAATTPGLVLKAVRLNGTDVTDDGFEIRAGEDVSDVEVVFVAQLGTLTGRVTDARGNGAVDYSTLVFPRDPARWTESSRFFGSSRADQSGAFKIANLPAGQYYAIALDYVEAGSDRDPDFLRRIQGKATPFTIGDTETKTLDLKLIAN